MQVKHSGQGLAGSCYSHQSAQTPSKALHGLQDKVQILSTGSQAFRHLAAPADTPSPPSSSPLAQALVWDCEKQGRPPPASSILLPPPARTCPPHSSPSFRVCRRVLQEEPPLIPKPDSGATHWTHFFHFPHPGLRLQAPWGSLCLAHCLAHSRMSEGQTVRPPCRLTVTRGPGAHAGSPCRAGSTGPSPEMKKPWEMSLPGQEGGGKNVKGQMQDHFYHLHSRYKAWQIVQGKLVPCNECFLCTRHCTKPSLALSHQILTTNSGDG